MSDALALVLRLNLAASAAVILVLLLRAPARRLFGTRIAYWLWTLPALAALAMLLPPRVVTLAETGWIMPASPPMQPAVVPALPISASALPDLQQVAVIVWLLGAAFALGHLAWRQARFASAVRDGLAGPAVLGVLRPRIVTPADFARRYTALERELVLAHEATHLARQDSRINALVALIRCLAWFNPLAHALARCLRIDQELACDAQVVACHRSARRAYAEAMFKTQLAQTPLPLGCYWPSAAPHPLAQRVALLARPTPGRIARAAGLASVSLAALAVGWSAWAARPPEFVWVSAPSSARAMPALLATPARPQPSRTPHRAPAAIPAAPKPAAAAPEAPPPTVVPVSAVLPPEGCGQREAPEGSRRLKPGDFGPARRIHSAAHWSSVAPGMAVRVYATAQDRDGVPLITDLTAFGSQSQYRVGCIRSNPSPERLFTSVIQRGDRLLVTASIRDGERWAASGTVDLASGESGEIALPDGRKVSVSAMARPETPEEIDAARSTAPERLFVNAGPFLRDS
ncbi:MAG: M56 family metallopeptidase [Phenylobacterium sp.]